MASPDAGYGQAQPHDSASDFNRMSFLIRQILNLVSTATLVQVTACTNSGDVSPVGFVDVQPLVNLIDGFGNTSEHGVIFHLPYCRLQGGTNAVICDPQVNDIGIAVFADRDISSVKANKAKSPPGSRRRFDMADGVYLLTVLGAAPTQYVEFTSDGIKIADKNGNSIVMNASGVVITALSGKTITIDSSGVATTGTLENEGVNVGSTHVHSGVQSGGSNSGPPH